ncbi:MAG TPA: SIS domain-containing protein [bacterium]|nr:SIS domain-containing protein [bacterium]HPQ65181.1 SIS domain-containing protein [bacterium]
MNHVERYLEELIAIARQLDRSAILNLVEELVSLRERGGRLFVIGVGGSAAAAAHAVNDFRKLAGIEAYAPTDNVSELTARTNDHGWETVFSGWLSESRLTPQDAILIFSVGGGDRERGISANIVSALEYARKRGSRVLGIVGRDGGATLKAADVCVLIPPVDPELVTPHTEAFHAVIHHLLVSHPRLQRSRAKWESAE